MLWALSHSRRTVRRLSPMMVTRRQAHHSRPHFKRWGFLLYQPEKSAPPPSAEPYAPGRRGSPPASEDSTCRVPAHDPPPRAVMMAADAFPAYAYGTESLRLCALPEDHLHQLQHQLHSRPCPLRHPFRFQPNPPGILPLVSWHPLMLGNRLSQMIMWHHKPFMESISSARKRTLFNTRHLYRIRSCWPRPCQD